MGTLIIAEAGVNHNGNLETAYKMIDVAKEAGVDIVKFQTSVTSTSKFSEKAEYQKRETGAEETQLEMIKKLRFSFAQHVQLKEYCDRIGIKYLSTPFDFESIEFLNGLGMDFWKVPSGEIVNIPYLERIGKTCKPVIMSTGMATMKEIGYAIDLLRENGCREIKLLQCTTEYPAAYEHVNLRAMKTLADTFRVEIGLSDHTRGIEVPIGPDHKASLEPDELKAMVKSIRHIEAALGNADKKPCADELENLYAARKSIVAKRDIKKGETFTEDNIVPRHAGRGISPAKWNDVLGKVAIRDFIEDEMIEL